MRTLVIIQMLLVLLGCLADEVVGSEDSSANSAQLAPATSAPCADQASGSACKANAN